MVVDVFNTLKKLLVELYFIFKVGHHRNNCCFCFFQVGRLVGLGHAEENACYAIQHLSAPLISEYRISKCWLLLIIGNLFYLPSLLCNSCLDGRKIVFALNLTKVGGIVG